MGTVEVVQKSGGESIKPTEQKVLLSAPGKQVNDIESVKATEDQPTEQNVLLPTPQQVETI